MDKEIDLYKILKIKQDASLSDIKKSYKKLILIYHPDKLQSKNHEHFIKIKYAYDILSNENSRNKYDYNKKNKNNDDLLINYLKIISNFLIFTEYNTILQILINKIYINNEKIIFKNIYKEKIISTITDITFDIIFSLKEVWNNTPKLIYLHRVTNILFEEPIYPIDRIQIYEKEGEKIIINNTNYIGNIIIKINILDTYRDEKYFIDNNDLFIIVRFSRIINNIFNFVFIDDKEYKINLLELKTKITFYGKFKYLEGFGLPYYDFKDILKSNTSSDNYNILQGNLFFILLI